MLPISLEIISFNHYRRINHISEKFHRLTLSKSLLYIKLSGFKSRLYSDRSTFTIFSWFLCPNIITKKWVSILSRLKIIPTHSQDIDPTILLQVLIITKIICTCTLVILYTRSVNRKVYRSHIVIHIYSVNVILLQ